MNIALHLARAARSFPDLPAVGLGPERRQTWRSLETRAASLARALTERFDLKPGDRVALVMSNCPEYLETLYGCWYAGLAAVPVNFRLHPRELAYILDHSGAACCFATEPLADAVEAARRESGSRAPVVVTGSRDYRALLECEPAPLAAAGPDDLAWLFYTSGTTGRPKGAMLTHRNLLAMTLNYFADLDQIEPEDCVLHAAPMSHGSGMYILPHVARAATQVVPVSGQFDPAEIFSLLARWRGVTMFAAPTMVKRLVEHPEAAKADLTHLKTVVYGGGPMYVADLERALLRFGNRFVQIYGQGEAPMTITVLSRQMHAAREHPRWRERLASAGIAQSVVAVRVADEEDGDLPVGAAGEVLVQGDVVMKGYWRDPEATARTLRGGWLHTGDVGSFDADGFLTLKDRSKDLIISGGSNIYPREVEEVLLRHPDVAEASVVGAPDPEWGESVVAFVVPRPGRAVSEAELDRLCLDHIARYKRPRRYRFIDQLPKNTYGKVLKTELRRLLAEGTASE